MTLFSVVKTVFWGCVLLSILVFLHEGGHYLLARLSGMRVSEFFLGMPCRFKLSFSSKKRGTEFGVTPVLLGGYTRICGMEGEPTEHCPEVLAYVVQQGRTTADRVSRALNISLEDAESDLEVLVDWCSIAAYSIAHNKLDDSYHDLSEVNLKDENIEEVAMYATLERDPELRTIYDKDHDHTLQGTTAGGEPHALVPLSQSSQNPGTEELVSSRTAAVAFYESERATTYLGKKFLPRFLTLVAGPLVNILLGLFSIAIVLSVTGTSVVVDTSTISGVSEGSIAEAAGLTGGDTILSINGNEVSSWTEFCAELDDASKQTDSFELTYSHTDSSEVLSTTIDSAKLKEAGMFGVYATTTMYHPPLTVSLKVAWSYVTSTAKYVVQLFMPQHTAEIVSQSSSVVGISVMASEAAESGASDFIYLLAVVSLSLGFMNLIPIPPLDGGKILLEIIEAIRRKPVPLKVKLYLSYAGLALFLGLFVFAVQQDILRFVVGG